jgi:hypothetical protein
LERHNVTRAQSVPVKGAAQTLRQSEKLFARQFGRVVGYDHVIWIFFHPRRSHGGNEMMRPLTCREIPARSIFRVWKRPA